MAQKNSVRDLTTGSPMKLILGFAVPMLVGYLFQQFYNMVDTIIVGKCIGVTALAAVGSTGSINFMINGFCIGVSSGFAIPVAQQFGAGDEKNLRKYVANAFLLTAAFAAVMTVVVATLCMRILQWTNTPDDIIQGAFDYIFIIFLGIPVTYFYNLFAGIIRSLGDSKTPVYFLLLSSVMNIVLDFFTILALGMGVSGPAIATVFSQGVSAVLCFFYMMKHYPILKMSSDERRPDPDKMRVLCSMGLPMGLQYSITAIGNVILQAAVNSLGSMVVAAVATGSKVGLFFCCPFDALGGTMATYAGQNVGAKKLDRVRDGVFAATLIGSIYAIAAFAVMTIFGRQLSLLFLDASETEVIHQVCQFLMFNSMFYIPLVIVNVFRFAIQGMGFSVFAILAGVSEMIARSLVGFLLVPRFGYLPACFGSPLAWIFADAFLIPAFFYCLRRLKKTFHM
jgi:putative MATE family efflux protein